MSSTKHNPKAVGLAQYFLSKILQIFLLPQTFYKGVVTAKGFLCNTLDNL